VESVDTNTATVKILVIDDERAIRKSLAFYFEDQGYQVLEAGDGKAGLELFASAEPQIVFTDLRMPFMDGFEFLRQAHQMRPEVPIVVVSGTGVVNDAVQAVKLGAWDYITKPVMDLAELDVVVRRALETVELRQEVSALRACMLDTALENESAFSAIITHDARMRRIFHYLEAVAPSTQPVLVTGETGTGKELIARAVHVLSRRKGRFVAVNAGGVDDTVFSDTLFGHLRGAFTGAERYREGMIVQAEQGTLFLDEIGDLSSASQTKLLRLIQEREYFPLGSDMAQNTNCRIVAATNRDLPAMVAAGSFRQDLYYRLCAHHVHIPPLRERSGDIGLLLESFVSEAARELGRPVPSVPVELARYLETYPFPGNIRELKSMVFDAVAQNGRGMLSKETFLAKLGKAGICPPQPSAGPVPGLDDGEERLPTLKEAEQALIKKALERAGGNQGVAARYLGITRQGLNKILHREKMFQDAK